MATTAEHVIRAAHRIVPAGSADLARMRKKLDKTYRRARKTANRGISVTDGYVHKHPWAAVGVAAGVVALAGIVLAAVVRNPRTSRGTVTAILHELRRAAAAHLNTR